MARLFSVRSFVNIPASIREWSHFFVGKDVSRPAATFLDGLYEGVGSPEGVVVATPGSIYANTAGGAGATLWVKESGVGDTGWIAK
jgi:hypothetical protein